MLRSWLLWMAVPFFETLSQICMKFASVTLDDAAFGMQWFIQAVHSAWFWGSLAADACGFFFWMAILRNVKLSVAFPVSSICFITVLLAGWTIFNETIYLEHVLGTVLIMSGIFLVSKGESS